MRKIDFNRDWTVQKEGQERVEHVNLPHDAMLYEKRAKENKTASASAYFEGGKYIYKKMWMPRQQSRPISWSLREFTRMRASASMEIRSRKDLMVIRIFM
mgnify:CR=1 FL=1